MEKHCHYSTVPVLLLVLTSLSCLRLSSSYHVSTDGHANNYHRDAPQQNLQPSVQRNSTEEEELFKDVDPKRLAAALLEAINHSQAVRGRKEEEQKGMGNTERGRVKKEEAYGEDASSPGDRDRDGQQKLGLLFAPHIDDEEERRKALEDEKLTEKVTSQTTSQTIQNQTEQQLSISEGGADVRDQRGSQEEEQLSPEELRSLETMMKEFPPLDVASRREEDSGKMRRQSRAFSRYNEILPVHKGSDLAMSKKKLKWQEETQKALNFPAFTGGNSINEIEASDYADNPAQPRPPAEQEVMEDYDPNEEEVLSPEEEEARVRVEQEEMMRQAEEAQRAKLEEEKLADMASDMLLRYMVKQNNGHKKYSSSLSSTAEDKRSDEEQDTLQQDDIDPETIDKLIEISSKLHLPADDVVDIITDAEKKKKKDVPPEVASYRQYPPSSSFTPGWHLSSNENKVPVYKPPFMAPNPLKARVQEKNALVSEDVRKKLSKFIQANRDPWSKPVQQNPWLKSSTPVWMDYPFSPYAPPIPLYHQRNPSPKHYPIYFPLLSRSSSRYYIPKPAFNLNSFLGNSGANGYPFTPRRRYQSWVWPGPRKPPTGLPQSYYKTYSPIVYPQQFQRILIPKAHPPPRAHARPPQHRFYKSAVGVTRNGDVYGGRERSASSSLADLEKYIEQRLRKGPQVVG
ncbi:uncharacterized protein vgf isoform 1-T2 [Menidia menidia]